MQICAKIEHGSPKEQRSCELQLASSSTHGFVPPNTRSTMYLIVALCLTGTITVSAKQSVFVSLQHGGRVQGSTLSTSKGTNFYAFRGIPYAEPPVEELRFKPPRPKSSWSEVFDATKDGPICTQINFHTGEARGEEDCLRINVYTRELTGSDKELSAVMVFIHGGAFMIGEGSSTFYSPDLLMNTDIVFVTLNYRLDAFGFLSTGDDVSPGNYGLLDQTLALKWIQENIKQFGGDPNRVTIFGESAGGASVSHHVLSPLSKGLFHRAISMSGAATCMWALSEDVSKWTQRLAQDLGCPTGSSQELVDCLRKQAADDIVKVTRTYMKISFCPIPFSPCVDGHFLPDHPLTLLRSPEKLNKIPVISGTVQKEGLFFIAHILSSNSDKSLTSREFQTNIVDYMFTNYRPVKEVTELVKESYLSSIDGNDEDQVREALTNAFSDGLFDMCHYETTNLMSEAGLQTYAYSYEYNSSSSFSQMFGIEKHNWGPSHVDDLLMLFPIPKGSPEQDQVMSNNMIKLWTNFAKYGEPTPEIDQSLPNWPSTDLNKFHVYHLNDPITVQPLTVDERSMKFWTQIIRNAKSKKYAHTHTDL